MSKLARCVLLLILSLLPLLLELAHADEARLMANGNTALIARIHEIENANSTVDVVYYQFYNDDASKALISALLNIKAHKKNVVVRMILDANGNKISKEILSLLLQSGIEVRLYNKPGILNFFSMARRMHDKAIIIDNETLIAGGRNVSDRFFETTTVNFLDHDIVIRGDVARDAQSHFNTMWVTHPVKNYNKLVSINKESVRKEISDARERILFKTQIRLQEFTDKSSWLKISKAEYLHNEAHFKLRNTENSISQKLLKFIDSAEHSILIETPYMLPTPRFEKAIKSAIDRGVHVRLLTNSLGSTDNLFTQAAYIGQKKRFVEMGIDLWELKGPHALHAKTISIDGKRTFIGSFNLDARSDLKNTENGVLVDSEEVAAQYTMDLNDRLLISYHIDSNGKPDGELERYPMVKNSKILTTWIIKLIIPLLKRQI